MASVILQKLVITFAGKEEKKKKITKYLIWFSKMKNEHLTWIKPVSLEVLRVPEEEEEKDLETDTDSDTNDKGVLILPHGTHSFVP